MVRRLLFAGLFLLLAHPCIAGLRVIGTDGQMRLDTAGFPPQMKVAYTLMQGKCSRCHSLERTIMAVTTGISPLSGRPFDQAAIAAYGQKMSRKNGSAMTTEEIRTVTGLLNYLVDKAKQDK